MNSNAPFVSVVTPFYNTEAYLADCIESVLRQTYENWEYVLVNNCSTDGSAQIAEKYSRAHPDKIRVVHNGSFLSQIANYNHALTTISPQSKYCKMVQADDLIFPQCLEMMVQVAEQDAAVGVVGSYGLEGRFVCFDGLPYPSPAVSGRDACRLFFFKDNYLFGSPTQLMLRSEVVRFRSPFYDDRYAPFEDAAVVFDLLQTWKFGFAHQVLTFSRRDEPTTMGRLLSFDCPSAFSLFMVRDFGSRYLDAAEYRDQLRRQERAYAQVLANGMVGLKGSAFWKFHTPMLKRMGYSWASPRVWEMLAWAFGDLLFNPKRTMLLFARGLKHRMQSGMRRHVSPDASVHVTEELRPPTSVP
jgi:glycosyltransferase involved in cell wall biosynthesis